MDETMGLAPLGRFRRGMSTPSAWLILGILLSMSVFVPTVASEPAAPTRLVDDTVIGIVDTGIRPTHEAFDTNQIMAWWDFLDAEPDVVPGAKWDASIEPYDDNGHGTAVASLAAGLATDPWAPSIACGGCALAIAKALDADGLGSIPTVVTAVKWLTQTVEADIIVLSLSARLLAVGPTLPAMTEMDTAIREARDAGALVIVSAGNGVANAALPGDPSWSHSPASSPDALVVSASSYEPSAMNAAKSGWFPEVSAAGISVRTAVADHDSAYRTWSGSSLATALVAGFAANLAAKSVADQDVWSPAYVEELMKRVALDTELPYAIEGNGFLGTSELERALEYASSGGVPPWNSDVNRMQDAAMHATRGLLQAAEI